jgi:hypothetical protein
MKNTIQFNTPDGVYNLDLLLVAKHRADYYKGRGSNYNEEIEFVMNDDFEGIDWLINNTDYEDWEDVTVKVNSNVNVTNEDFWCSSEDFEIITINK